MKSRLALFATVVALTAGAANLLEQDQPLPATPYMGRAVELVTTGDAAEAARVLGLFDPYDTPRAVVIPPSSLAQGHM